MIALIGGTGPEGKGLALRFAAAGEIVMIGSRYRERALAAAEEVRQRVPDAWVRGAHNRRAAREADMIVLTIPFEAHARIIKSISEYVRGKIVIDTVVPLSFKKGRIDVIPVEQGSAAEQAQAMLPDTRVVAAFLNLSAVNLVDLERPLDADVVVCGDNVAARNVTMSLINRIPGLRAVNGDGLASARHLEEITALLLTLNRTHRAHTSIKITGI
jgi:8-hydroxy-5-deazaflavin:NADPH oxidoreductase